MLRQVFAESFATRNVATVQLLGLCPLLAVSYSLENAIGLASASTFVLLASSLTISLFRKLIPKNIRLPCFVLIVATLTTVVVMLAQAYAWDLYIQVALFMQIIVTNCMILGHIENVAARQSVLVSMINASGTALGFSAALIVFGSVRQLLSEVMPLAAHPIGAFLIAGSLLALVNLYTKKD